MSLPYNAGVPQGNQTIAETQDPILKNFSSIDKAFNGETGGGTPFTTYNLQNTTANYAAVPAVGKSGLYTTNSSANHAELAYINDGNATGAGPFQGVRVTGGGITAAAWVYFDGTTGGSPFLPISSYNVSNITRISPGVYQINFTRPFTNANYCVTGSLQGLNWNAFFFLDLYDPAFRTVSSFQCRTLGSGGGAPAPSNNPQVCLTFFGILA